MTILATLPASITTNVILGPAVLFINGVTAWGASQGGITMNLPHEYENLPFDGKMIDIATLDRRMGGIPSFEGTFFEMTAARALELEPGGTSATASSVTTITPKPFGEFLGAGDYANNVRVAWRGGALGLFVVEFDKGLLMAEEIASDGTNGNATYKVKFVARQKSDAASLGVAPYTLKLAADITTINTPDAT